MRYESPLVTDYGDVLDITAAQDFRQRPDAEAPGEPPLGNLDDTTGACVPLTICV